MKTGFLTVAGLAAALVAPALAQELQPFQQAALDRVLASYPAEERAMLRPQLEMMFSQMDAATIAMMEEAMMNQAEPVEDDFDYEEASEDDLAFNTAQYEPVATAYFEIGTAFDAFVAQAAARHAPAAPYAVWGQAWRYELPSLEVFELDLGAEPRAYLARIEMMAPHDGRYRFDLPAAPTGFDAAGVEAALAEAFEAYRALGERFETRIRALAAAQDHEGAHEHEGQARGELAAIEEHLATRLQALAPMDRGEIAEALMNGQRLN